MGLQVESVEDIFAEESLYQAYLDVEVALAKAQASQGIIPGWAAARIEEVARIELLDLDNIHIGLEKTGHPLVPIIWELDRVCGEEAGGYIHWGATTQNITQTGKLLLIKRCHGAFLTEMARLLEVFAQLAEDTKSFAMPGRTHGQHAVPATFGYKVAVWIDEILRHTERLKACEKRVFVVMLGGGGGTMASVGLEGLKTQNLMAEELGMESMTMPSRVIGDHLTEYVLLFSMFAATSNKIAREIYTLMKQEFGEVEEPVPPGTVGSSTMPQKRNPRLCQEILAWSTEVRTYVPMALESMQTEHEADGSTGKMIDMALDRTCILSYRIITALREIFKDIKVFPERMRSNLDLSGGLIMSERIMLELGKEIGRQRAHDVVYEAAQKSVNEKIPFAKTLAQEPEVTSRLSASDLEELLNPEHYTGLCRYFAETFAEKARREAALIIKNI